MKPNVLVVTRNLPPLIGGMERLIWHLVDELRADYQVHVAGPTGCKSHLPSDVNVTEISLKPICFFLLRCKLATLWMSLRYRPVVILAGSGLTAPFVWLASRLTGSRCIVYLHGLDIKVSHPLYHLLWLPFFRRFDCVLVNSNFTRQLALDAKISSSRIIILHPGVELPHMDEARKRRKSFRLKHHFDELPLMLSVGRITSRKGLLSFVNEIMPHIMAEVPETMLAVIGDEPTNALMSVMDERARVKCALEVNDLSSKVSWLGCCSQKELDDAYFAADVLIFPVQQRENDIEGFGMVAIEGAAHGLPTVAFAVGGVTDAVADGCSGKLIPVDDNRAFAQAVIELLRKQKSFEQVNGCRNFAESFEWPAFGTRLKTICRDIDTGNNDLANI